MGATLFGVLWVLLSSLQEAKKDDLSALKADVAQALSQTAKAGSFTIAGQMTTEAREDQTEDEPTVCQVSGAVAVQPFQAALRVKAEHSAHELYFTQGKLAGLLVWRSAPLDLGKAPSELLSLLELDRLALFVEKAPEAAAAPGEAVGGAACRSIRLRLGGDTVRGHSEDNDAVEEDERGLNAVEAQVWIDSAKGTVARISARVRRVYKDARNPDAPAEKASSSYDFVLGELGRAKVSIPKRVQRALND